MNLCMFEGVPGIIPVPAINFITFTLFNFAPVFNFTCLNLFQLHLLLTLY